ncbi:EthD domain-containing protein [Parafrankia elaeagni]|uniref:EthD domain-containing protein n=1 Tax=Parafrankia elaeagni TaxID=222534 RepID=UPI0003A5FC4E|nr:EthD domain-containing protein [Parafrankia elaeagni]
MIKRILFATRREATVPAEAVASAWRQAADAVAEAPAAARPLRAVVCTALDDPRFGSPRHDLVGIEWFPDAARFAAHQVWLDSPAGLAARSLVDEATAPGATLIVVARERVPRGADWLAARWRGGGIRFKHLALARRAAGLTPAAFSDLWAAHAGQLPVAAATAPAVIPERVRGSAYVQNHPCPRPAGEEWPYDAVNEVYFTDQDGLAERVAWFRENPPDAGGDLFGPSEFLAVREELLLAAPPGQPPG